MNISAEQTLHFSTQPADIKPHVKASDRHPVEGELGPEPSLPATKGISLMALSTVKQTPFCQVSGNEPRARALSS